MYLTMVSLIYPLKKVEEEDDSSANKKNGSGFRTLG